MYSGEYINIIQLATKINEIIEKLQEFEKRVGRLEGQINNRKKVFPEED